MDAKASRRRTWTIALGAILFLLLVAYTAVNAFNLKFLAPATTGDIVGFVALSVVVFLIFVTVLVLLVRNVLKLYADQRSRVLGIRMLWGAVLVSLVPLVFMFAFSRCPISRF